MQRLFGSFFPSSSEGRGPTPTDTPTPQEPTPTPSLPQSGQKNLTSEYPMPNHPKAQQHFDGVRETVKVNHAESPEVLKLSSQMGESRSGWSTSNPKASDKDAIHANQAKDAGMQLDAVMRHQIPPDQILPMVSTSTPPFVDSLTDKEKRPETLAQGGNALLATACGFMSILNDPSNRTY